jgi:hypothetical protein
MPSLGGRWRLAAGPGRGTATAGGEIAPHAARTLPLASCRHALGTYDAMAREDRSCCVVHTVLICCLDLAFDRQPVDRDVPSYVVRAEAGVRVCVCCVDRAM